MRKCLLLFICLLGISYSFSQNTFEGVVKFKTEITGKNPVMVGMMPDSFIFLFKNKDSKIILQGGIVSAMMGDIISKGDSNVSFMLNSADKIAYRFDKDKFEKKITVDIEETGKTKNILNKKCTLFRISYDTKDGNVVTDIWMTDELDVSFPRNNPMGKYFVYAELLGFPLLIESKIKYQSSEFDVILSAVKIIERPVPSGEFVIPKNYKIVPLLSTSETDF
jgi:hypothetical protein